MTITVDHIQLFQSERMTDNDDGGGQMSGVAIVSGVENQIVDDISDVDRAIGDVSIRKVYGAVTSANTDKFLDSGFIVAKAPADDDVSVLLFSTDNFYDERTDLADALQRYREASSASPFRLKGTHNIGQRALFGYMLKSLLATGQTPTDLFFDKVLCLESDSATQFVRVTRVFTTSVNYTDSSGSFAVAEINLDIDPPLTAAFPGAADSSLSTYTPPTLTYYTQLGTPTTCVGVADLIADASSGDSTVTASAVKASLVPVEYQDLGEFAFTLGNAEYLGLNYPYITQILNAPAGYSLSVTPTVTPNLSAWVESVAGVAIWYRYGDEWIGPGHSKAATYYHYSSASADRISFPVIPDSGSKVFIKYLPADARSWQSAGLSSTVVSSFSMTISGTIYPGSVMVGPSDGNANYTLYDQGDGTLSGAGGTGTINYSTGAITATLTYSLAGNLLGASKSTVAAIWQRTSVSAMVSAPIIEGYTLVSANASDDGALIASTTDVSGTLSGASITGTVDYTTGLVTATFPEAIEPETFSVTYRLGGVIAQSPTILGLDSTRLPKDGKVPIFRLGDLVLIHHTGTVAESSLTASQVVDCGRTGLYRADIIDSAGLSVPSVNYTVDRAAGTVTMASVIDLTGLTAPFSIRHTIADLVRLNGVDPSGLLTLNKTLTHSYSASGGARVSSLLFSGTLQARIENVFMQSAWTGVWSDEVIGTPPTAQYNHALWPILTSNLGAYPDDILIKFTSSTAFQVIGKNLGVIGVGDVLTDCSPINPTSGAAYLTIRYQGWGSGLATGNCLRFKLIASAYPVGVVRCIQPSPPSGVNPDDVEIWLIGNVDA